MLKKNKIIFLAGPTAVGKTEVAIYLAKKINAEIISCDSMQIYKGMDIITSKPALSLRRAVSHHLLDIVSPSKEYNVSRYRKAALKVIKEIIERGKTPLFVGGTGLYISILIDGIFNFKPKTKTIRKRLLKEAQTYGSQYLYNRLRAVDQKAASKIHPNDTKRIVRALEVFEATGKPISFLQQQRTGLAEDFAVTIFCLNRRRDELNKRIDGRIEKMFANGLIAEAGKLLKGRLSKTAVCAIGIKELKGYLEGSYDLEEAKRLMKRNSRLYAKRQLTWFRKDKRIKWVNICAREKAKDTAKKIWKKLY